MMAYQIGFAPILVGILCTSAAFSAKATEHSGNLTLSSDADVVAARDVTVITGDLIVDTSAVTHLDLPELSTVGGYINIASNPSLSAIAFPNLISIGGAIVAGPDPFALRIVLNPELCKLELRNFEHSSGRIIILENHRLQSVHFPKLRLSEGAIVVENNEYLSSLRAPKLYVVGASADILSHGRHFQRGILIALNPSLTTIDFRKLRRLSGQLEISSNRSLRKIDLPRLLHVRGPDFFSGPQGPGPTPEPSISISENLVLQSLYLGNLIRTEFGFRVTGNPQLAQTNLRWFRSANNEVEFRLNSSLRNLTLPSLVEAGALVVSNNAGLKKINVPHLQSLTGTPAFDENFQPYSLALTITGNASLKNVWAANLREASGNLLITDNHTLPMCQAQSIIDELIVLDGTATVSENGPGDCD